MMGAVLALALALAVGVPLALALPGRPSRLSLLIGEGFLLGNGAIAVLLATLSLVGVQWSVLALIGSSALLSAIAIAIVIRNGRQKITRPSPGWANAIDVLTLALVAGFARFATAAPPAEIDYIAIWGLKAKVFWFAHGIDWSFLHRPLNVSAHVDYPILLPLVFDAQALLTGTWPEQWMGIVTAAFGVAALFVVRGMLAEELGDLASALIALALMPLLFSSYIGLAEGPLIAYSVAGLLWMRHALQQGSGPHVLRASIYFGFAASCKNEGLTLIVAALIALVAAKGFRFLPRVWPALAIPGPWWILKTLHHFPNDLMAPGVVQRMSVALVHPAPVVRALMEHPVGQPLFWVGVIVACVIGWRRIAAEERFLALAVFLQFAFFIGVYFATPNDVLWQVKWSWERIVRQLMPVVALTAFFSTLPMLYRRPTVVIGSPHAADPR